MTARLPGGGRAPCGTAGAFLWACLLSAGHASRSCGDVQCGVGQQCCPPVGTANGSAGAAVRCCRLPIHVFFDNVGWFTRKLSGILILLLLFAMGYFIQRIICPRPRRPPHNERPDEPSLFRGRTSASQDSLLDRCPGSGAGDFASPSLPTYDEVKYLPTYEESMQEMRRDRSDENLLSDAESGGGGGGRARAGAPRAAEQRRGDVPEAPGQQQQQQQQQHSPRTARNSV